MASSTIDRIVGEVLESTPLPNTFDGLDKLTRRLIEREAASKGVTPEALYDEKKRAAELAQTARSEAAEVAARVRRHGY